MNDKNVVDSSGWIEYFANTEQGKHFTSAIESLDTLIVPVVTLYEVIKTVTRESGAADAAYAADAMRLGYVVNIDETVILEAVRHRLPLADSLIYATTLLHNATLWTQDAHFKDLPSVHYLAKSSV